MIVVSQVALSADGSTAVFHADLDTINIVPSFVPASQVPVGDAAFQ
jgi:hypothetical protein